MKVHVLSHNALVEFPDDMHPDEVQAVLVQHFPGRPTHDDLAGAAVTGQDSLDLQDMAPEVKPAVKMTLDEFYSAQIAPEKPFFAPGNGTVYVFTENAAGLESAVENIIAGNDSEILGYPSREGLEKGEMVDVAVTKQGEVITDIARMRDEAQAGNVAWAAEGAEAEVIAKAEQVAAAIQRKEQTT